MTLHSTQKVEASGPSHLILAHIPNAERASLLKSLIDSLQPSDSTNLSFVASLVVQDDGEDTKFRLLEFLEGAVRNGCEATAISISLQYPRLGVDLLDRVADAVSKAKSAEVDSLNDAGTLQSYLRFSKSTAHQFPTGKAQQKLFDACLDLLSTGSQGVSLSARDVLFSLLPATAASSSIVFQYQSRIWDTIQKLAISKSNKLHSVLAYSLWLRWILSVRESIPEGFIGQSYWDLLLHGLRIGDVERRKLCLNILKISTTMDSAGVTREFRPQYDRYCTVFETIVLGRYINQIQECEPDLDFLAAGSALSPQWLYVLLASALDNHMQDSNRKFIGNWVMRSKLNPSTEFLSFFRDDFLSWATQGQLFVSTLRKQHDTMRCLHGDRLSRFIQVLREKSSDPNQITEMVVALILRKRNSMFAYATIYLLEGLNQSVSEHQMGKIAELTGLPEVARDYISNKAHELGIYLPAKPKSRRDVLEQQAIEKTTLFTGGADNLGDIWSDLDYLEYPKRLLGYMTVFVQPKIIQRARTDPGRAADLAERFRTLYRVSETKSYFFPRLVSALRTTLLSCPSTAEVLDLEDFVIRVADQPPEPNIDLKLEEATTNLMPPEKNYAHYFGDPLSYGMAVFLDLVSRLSPHQVLVHLIIDRILQRWKNQKIPPPTVCAWKTTLQLQVLLLCFEQYSFASTTEIHSRLEDLFHILAIEPLPRYRYLLEWIIVRLFMRFKLEDFILEKLATKDHHSNPKHLASLMKIGVVLASGSDSREDFVSHLMTTFVPLSASSKVVIRHEAQWQVPILMDYARDRQWMSITTNSALIALDEYIRSLERFHDPPFERQLGRFNPATDHTLTNLVEGRWFELDNTEAPCTWRDDLIELYHRDRKEMGLEDWPPSCLVLGSEIERPVRSSQVQSDTETGDNKQAIGPRTADDVSTALQTKGTAYLSRALTTLGSAESSRTTSLIVVGSLVENPHNLGGLSRVAEIFGASALCLQNQNVTSNKDFLSVSVSSHLHFPLVQLSASGVPAYLAERKGEGFTVVGIEQTDRSVVLGSEEAKLPHEKVVLIVGSEKEGIPAAVLTECDTLVEIPQQGVTRSLNVQTAVGIVLYEHARQRNLRQDKFENGKD